MMDLYAMKRKKLQSLCKKHGIPANLKNTEMADRLSLILKGTGSDNGGTDNDETSEMNSNNSNNLQMVASDTLDLSVDAKEEKIVSLGKRCPSPNLEERIGFSPKILKVSEIERLESKTNSTPEKTKDDVEIVDVEENMVSGGIEEQIDEHQKGALHSAPCEVVMKDVVDLVIPSGEFGTNLKESEVEKLSDNTSASDDVCGTGKGESEAEKQDGTNSLQGCSNMNELNPLLGSPDEYGYPLVVEGEAHKSGDDVCVHGGVYDIVNKEQVDGIQEALLMAPSAVIVNNVDFVHFASEEFGDKTDAQEDNCGTGKGGAEALKQDDGTNGPQGSRINDVNLPHASPEVSGYPLVEGEVQKSNVTMCFVDTDGKTNVTTEHFSDEVHLSSFKYSDGGPGQFLITSPLSEAKSSDLNIHQMVVSGNDAGNADACEVKFVASPKTSLSTDSGNIICFSPNILNDLETKALEFETNFPPEAPKDDVEICDVEENMNIVDHVHVSLEEFGNRLVESEVEKFSDKTNVSEDVCGVGKGGIEAEKQYETNSPQGSNINEANPMESGYMLVEEEVQKSDDTISVHDSANKSGVSEVDTMCLLDSSLTPRNTDAKAVEHFSDQFDSSSFKHSDGKPDQILETYPPSEVKSSDFNINQSVVSGNANGNADACEEIFVPSSKISISLDSKKVIGFSPDILNDLATKGLEFEMNLSQETPKDDLCLLDASITAKNTDWKTNVAAEHFPDQAHSSNFEYSDGIPDQFLTTFLPSEAKSSDFNIHKIVASDITKENLESSQKKLLVADPEECNEFHSKHLDASEMKGFEAETDCDPSTLRDIAGACNMKENMQCVKTDTVSGDEDICQEKLASSPKCTPIASSQKRNNYFSKLLESSVMKKELGNETNLTLKTSGDILGTCDMKENIKTAKEQFGSTISKKTFPKRQPLQDLQQQK